MPTRHFVGANRSDRGIGSKIVDRGVEHSPSARRGMIVQKIAEEMSG